LPSSIINSKKNDTQDHLAPELELACNCRSSFQNITDKMSGLVLGSAAGRVGNWVAGTLKCYDTRMVFFARSSIRPFKKTAPPQVFLYTCIDEVRVGSLLFVAKTVDIDTGSGWVRFRCWGENNQQLYEFLLAKTGNAPK